MKCSSRFKAKSLEHENDHNYLDFITLNVDLINMSDNHLSLRSCLYKQTATYYFIEALIHEIGFKI